MLKQYLNFNIQKKFKKSIILIGNFDGLHSGHQKLFRIAKSYAKKFKLKVGVLTFEPLPVMFFNKKIKNFRITNNYQKKILFKKEGVNFIIVKKFDKKFSKISSLDFIKNIIAKKLNPKFIFVSDNFRYGFNRTGNVKQLKNYEKIYKYKIINPSPFKNNKKIVSSTLIRKYLQDGKLKIVNKLLKRRWSINGVVRRGKQIGKKMGFPTCNLYMSDYILPKLGVYSVITKIGNSNKNIKGIANIGQRPTFGGKEVFLEVFLFNFNGNLYNKTLNVQFCSFIRNEKKFISPKHLVQQIKKDLIKAKFDLKKL